MSMRRMSVLVVDDEAIVRIALKTIIPWEENGFELIGTAQDAAQALELIGHHQPDILITDLKMPGMDGLELLRLLQERRYDGKFIVLSNYGEYELVREAMKLGAMDYLLKVTLQPEELLELLMKASAQLRDVREQQEQQYRIRSEWNENRYLLRTQFYRELLLEETSLAALRRQAEKLGIAAVMQPGFVLCLRIESYEEALQSGKIKDKKLLGFSVHNIVGEAARERAAVDVAELSPDTYAVIASSEGGCTGKEKQLQFAGHIASVLKMYLNLEVGITVGGQFDRYEEVREAYLMTAHAMDMLFYGGSPILHIGEVEHTETLEAEAFTFLSRELKQAVDRNETGTILSLLAPVLKRAEEERLSPEPLKRWGMLVLSELEKQLIGWGNTTISPLEEYGMRLQGASSFTEYKEALAGAVTETGRLLAVLKDVLYRKETTAVIDYIRRNLDKKITLGQIAAEVNMSENYLSRFFKQETGKTVVEFIHQTRMEQAQELLKDPDCTVKSVALAVGVEDPFYFNRLFKKHAGINPTEYKRRVLGKRVQE
ncbi:response regulator [Paenibacillus sp. FJAT-26967]|uniref:response regulator transcription factor n=1 Tax=Paenibacillus sp. FJAT-26967 TaxID=1729690 RepID=UPI000839A3F1|nr:response regulator [Paenibacillus sp. FJAT-26967]